MIKYIIVVLATSVPVEHSFPEYTYHEGQCLDWAKMTQSRFDEKLTCIAQKD